MAGGNAKSSSRKSRLDQLLVDRGLVESRTRAQALIMAGMVFAGDRRLDKAGQSVAVDTDIQVKGRDHPWVSRGGLKLAHGLAHFGLSVDGRNCIDIGASTGGFTEVLLANGARMVFAVDVGQGQLDWKLRQDPRVRVLEKTNARYLTEREIDEPVTFLACDASFISLKTVLPPALGLAEGDADLIALIKPQFEVGREQVGKKGVVRDPALHDEVCLDIRAWLDGFGGWRVQGIAESPITGPEGNKEFLIAARKSAL